MELYKYIVFAAFLLSSTQSAAINLVELSQPIDESLYDSRSCNDLYMQASALEKESFANQSSSFGKRTQVASFVSAVFAPAIYYLGYSALQDYKSGIRSKTAFEEVEEIRFRMAEKRCFTK
jgi:hypothetical protein